MMGTLYMRIGIVGHFGDGYRLLNGQTVKTKNLYDGLSKYTNHSLAKVDTYRWSRHPVKLLIELRKIFKNCDIVIMLTAQNGVKVLPRVFEIFKMKYNPQIYYDVVGGWLPDLLSTNKKILRILQHFNGIWVETETMKRALESLNLINVTVIPNFKELHLLKESELEFSSDIPLRLCTFSRVMKEKGIDTIVEVVREVNQDLKNTVFSLDIYGQVQSGQEEWFENLKKSSPRFVQYKGCVDSEKSVEVLKNYFALVFPTHFYTEGIPGTIIDAYCAGLPVISARWENFNDVIEEGETGYGYEFDNKEALKRLLLSVAVEPQKILRLRNNCLNKARKFAPDKIIKDIEMFTLGV